MPTRAWTRRSPAINLKVVCPEEITLHHFCGSHQSLGINIMAWKFRCELKDEIPLPPDYSFPQAFNYLNPESNSFYILENDRGYMQCGGSKEKCTVEIREYNDDGTFRHLVFFDPIGTNDPEHIPMSAGGVHRENRHCLHFSKAIQLFKAYYNDEPWPEGLEVEDITNEFK